jgi:hypothetical protein
VSERPGLLKLFQIGQVFQASTRQLVALVRRKHLLNCGANPKSRRTEATLNAFSAPRAIQISISPVERQLP